jgi:myo-inositol-1(or 4)-monophosphatase
MEEFTRLVETVTAAGDMAAARQQTVVRTFKPDGSVLTEPDLEADRMITKSIKSLFSDVNIITEEYPSTFLPGKTWTFAVDPIDGSDSYSQGMPGWCVAVGILNEHLEPAGGIVYAPRWGSDRNRGILLTALPGENVLINGEPLEEPPAEKHRSQQLMISSKLHRKFDLSAYPGKVRSIGSTILHLVAPVIHPGVAGALLAPCFIWDMAAAHGIIARRGLSLAYLSGEEIDYSVLVHRQKARGHIAAGSADTVAELRACFVETSTID